MKDTSSKKNNMKTPHKRILRAMELWALYGAGYATAIDTYRALLQRKRDLKIRPPKCHSGRNITGISGYSFSENPRGIQGASLFGKSRCGWH